MKDDDLDDSPPTPPPPRPPSSVGVPSPDAGARIGIGMLVLILVIVLGAGSLLAQRYLDRREADARGLVTSPDSLELRADPLGHYFVTATLDGERVDLLVDTGASSIALPVEVADRIGLVRGRERWVETANGPAKGWTTSIDRLTIGPFERRDVDALVVPGLQSGEGLLGMSFLREFELVQRGGRLMLRSP